MNITDELFAERREQMQARMKAYSREELLTRIRTISEMLPKMQSELAMLRRTFKKKKQAV